MAWVNWDGERMKTKGLSTSFCLNNNMNKMSNFTKPLESSTRKKIDSWLNELDWNTNEEDFNCNVFTERAKTQT